MERIIDKRCDLTIMAEVMPHQTQQIINQ